MNWETVASISGLVALYIGSVLLAIRFTNNTIGNIIGKRIDDLHGDVKNIEVGMKSSDSKFLQHLNEFHSNTPEERKLWKPYFDS